MKPKIGRPKLDVTRAVLIGARFTPAEAHVIEAAAAEAHQVKSDWIRQVLLAAAGRQPAANPPSGSAPLVFSSQDPEFLD